MSKENFWKGRCKSPCADINSKAIVTWVSLVSRGMNILFKFSMLSSIHSLRSVPSPWLCRPGPCTMWIIWSLMKLENSRDWLQLCSRWRCQARGRELQPGMETRLACSGPGQLKLLPRCGSDLVTNLITDAQQFFSTWSDNCSDEHFDTLRFFIKPNVLCAWVSSALPPQNLWPTPCRGLWFLARVRQSSRVW